jgi:hypothetical protein
MQTVVAAYYNVLSQYSPEKTENDAVLLRQDSRGMTRIFHSIKQEYEPVHPDVWWLYDSEKKMEDKTLRLALSLFSVKALCRDYPTKSE